MAVTETPARPPVLPRATLRLQFHKGFTFDDAAPLVPYFAALGISHVYASPILMARPGSTHGYDITDHNRFNPEVGDAASFDRLVERLHAHGMGLILDFVPNHMGVGGADNPWWLDVLEWGRSSPFAEFFDIDWDPAEPTLTNKVLLPFLGDPYGKVLENGQLRLHFNDERGTFSVRYYDHLFPIAPRDYPALLRAVRERLGNDAQTEPLTRLIAEFAAIHAGRLAVRQQVMVRGRADELKGRLAALVQAQPAIRAALDAVLERYNGTPGVSHTFRLLHALLERQPYRVAYWRVATSEINYRRFFDINDLAGLRMEQPELFELSHQLIFRLIAEGKLQGLRLDHIDGLHDPAAYCRKLQDRAAYLLLHRDGGSAAPPLPAEAMTRIPRSHPFYLVVEKILARHERLREEWPVDGTTGYEYMNQVNGLFVDPAAEEAMTAVYQRFTGREPTFEELVIEAKRQTLTTNLASELGVLASELHALARQSWATRDFTLTGIQDALSDVVAAFPVYRTYITAEGLDEGDRRYLDWAVGQARKWAPLGDTTIYDFLYGVLTTDLRHSNAGYRSADILRVAMKFQQFTGPVMAKSLEDTAFYRYYRLVSLNEVGGEPSRFGVSPVAFHRISQERQRRHPFTLLATATHDHKRGEDTRLRIDALTELADDWRRRVTRWAQLNRTRKRLADGLLSPNRNDEYLLYQTLVGAWPLGLEPGDGAGMAAFADRIVAYMIKAVREAKRRTAWARPNAAYEEAVECFARDLLDPARSPGFLTDFLRFQPRVAVIAAVNGLAQTALKLTSPGVPDLYQGTEFWDLSLVDPDNRRPIDYPARQAGLDSAAAAVPAELLAAWQDGRVKQQVIARTLALRRAYPSLFTDGDYAPLETAGARADRVVAFRRRNDGIGLVVVVPRLVAPLLDNSGLPLPPPAAWGDTTVALSDTGQGMVYRDIMTGATREAAPALPLAALLAEFPVAILHGMTETAPPAA